jgi:hypothetical protein
MECIFQNMLIETIKSKSKEIIISLRDGKSTQIKAVTFTQLARLLGIDNSKNMEKLRELKRQLIALVENEMIVEIESEPTFYLLRNEFIDKIGSKSNISGIEGFA